MFDTANTIFLYMNENCGPGSITKRTHIQGCTLERAGIAVVGNPATSIPFLLLSEGIYLYYYI